MCTVRKLSSDDAAALAPLRREALEGHPLAFGSVVPDDPDQLMDFFRRALTSEESEIFGAIVNDGLVGMVGVRRDPGAKARHKALVWGMYVRSAFRRTGSGGRLLRAAVEQARAWPGVDQVHLAVSEVAEDAAKLYARFGFREWGREPRALCWQGRCVDERHLVLELRGKPAPQS
jgi:RimJ/RimL family protein N-acetyltransferase